MFAICSVQEFKPDKVTEKSNPYKENNPINLDHVRTFYKGSNYVFGAKDDNYPTIIFEYKKNEYDTWYFTSQEECDEEYGGLLYKVYKRTEKS